MNRHMCQLRHEEFPGFETMMEKYNTIVFELLKNFSSNMYTLNTGNFIKPITYNQNQLCRIFKDLKFSKKLT